MAKKPNALSLVNTSPAAMPEPALPANERADALALPAAQIADAVSVVVGDYVKSTETVGSVAAEAAGVVSTALDSAGKTIHDQTIHPQTIHPMAGLFAGFIQTPTEAKSKMENAIKTGEQIVSFGQGNVEAMMKSSQIWAAGVQDLGKSFAAAAQAQLDQTMSTWKALTGVKSLKEAMDLQSSLARSSVEQVMAQTGQLTDASMKLAEQAMAPITARVTLAVEQFGRTA